MNATTIGLILQALEAALPAILALLPTQTHTIPPATKAEHTSNLQAALAAIKDLKAVHAAATAAQEPAPATTEV